MLKHYLFLFYCDCYPLKKNWIPFRQYWFVLNLLNLASSEKKSEKKNIYGGVDGQTVKWSKDRHMNLWLSWAKTTTKSDKDVFETWTYLKTNNAVMISCDFCRSLFLAKRSKFLVVCKSLEFFFRIFPHGNRLGTKDDWLIFPFEFNFWKKQ